MPYDLDQFSADCRQTLYRDPGPAGRDQVRAKLERLLANQDFIKSTVGGDVPLGLKVLYEDKEMGFQVLAHVNDKARKSPPHDHGESWAIYGRPPGPPNMTKWERPANAGEAPHRKQINAYPLPPPPARPSPTPSRPPSPILPP